MCYAQKQACFFNTRVQLEGMGIVMTERKVQPRYIPLRVRFRHSSDTAQVDREHVSSAGTDASGLSPHLPDFAHASEAERHAQQIKELLHVCELLRTDLRLDDVLQRIASSTAACTGFHTLVMRLLDETGELLTPVAFSGLSQEQQRMLREAPVPIKTLEQLMRPEFQCGQSYFISHQHTSASSDSLRIVHQSTETHEVENWHPQDLLFVPLYSVWGRTLLGVLSLAEPDDGKIPTVESVEVVELFANKAAFAIDNALQFQKREDERIALDQAIVQLCDDVRRVQRGDLSHRVRSTHAKLEPIVEAVNVTVNEFNGILGNVEMVTQGVNEQGRNVQQSSQQLLQSTAQQEHLVQQISQVIADVSAQVQNITERSELLAKKTNELSDISTEAQKAMDRLVGGMGVVRDATMRSSIMLKKMGENGQQVGETVQGLTDVTTRMHLLALNAAIEAVRVGEQGKGFKNIAQEIRNLALQSADVARKASNSINIIQEEGGKVSQSFEQNVQQVVMQTDIVTQTTLAVEAIHVALADLPPLVQTISATSGAQARSSQKTVETLHEMLRVKSDINEHMRDVQHSLEQLVDLTNMLHTHLISNSSANRL